MTKKHKQQPTTAKDLYKNEKSFVYIFEKILLRSKLSTRLVTKSFNGFVETGNPLVSSRDFLAQKIDQSRINKEKKQGM